MNGAELEREQAYVSALYGRLDELRERTSARLSEIFAQGGGGTNQARVERDSLASLYADRLAQLWAAERGLCFGRIDRQDAARLYIGRMGLGDDEHERLLIDWRAPAAQAFYRATPAAPDGLVRRRHIRTTGRTVIGVDDDVFDLAALTADERAGLSGEAALMAALSESRTGRMGDIVATIQAEQDRIIRGELGGILVVQGGPGTGKTVVGLHRAAYLLYTHRRTLDRRGVLVLGPNATFLRYIDQVLPSLGETDVVLSTVDRLFPGITVTAAEQAEVSLLKGDPRMAEVIASAVRARRLPADIEVTVDGLTLRLGRQDVTQAWARGVRKPYNQARRLFVREVLDRLARRQAAQLGRSFIDENDLADVRESLAEERPVRAAINRLWPPLLPEKLLSDLFSTPARLAEAAPHLDPAERNLLIRPSEHGWTAADVPLLDEAAELLGELDLPHRPDADRLEAIAYAREVLTLLGLDATMDAEQLAERHVSDLDHRTTAERAAQDRTWAFGHVIVDEAQELSPMAWRMVMRRCPTRSMTLVGDLAQTGSPSGASSWGAVLDPYGRWRVAELTVNYRTPAEIMAVAADVLAGIDVSLIVPKSVRTGTVAPWRLRVDDVLRSLPDLTKPETGTLAVIAPASLAPLIDLPRGDDPAALDAPAVVLTVAQAKGLEFDSVLVVEPGQILAESPRGASDLYVALTRATQCLGVIHTGDLPSPLERLCPP